MVTSPDRHTGGEGRRLGERRRTAEFALRVEHHPLVERALAPFRRFSEFEAAGGIVLLACTVVALAWANSPWAASYHHLWEQPVGLAFGPLDVRATVHALINDGLMAVFF